MSILLFAVCQSPTNREAAQATTSNLPYRNLHDTVKYVGMQACQSCHQETYESFMKTGMGQSFDHATPQKSSAEFGDHIAAHGIPLYRARTHRRPTDGKHAIEGTIDVHVAGSVDAGRGKTQVPTGTKYFIHKEMLGLPQAGRRRTQRWPGHRLRAEQITGRPADRDPRPEP